MKIDVREFNFSSSERGLSKNAVKVGDRVGFNKDGEELVGCVERLNQKTISLMTSTGQHWCIAYQFLYSVIELHDEPLEIMIITDGRGSL